MDFLLNKVFQQLAFNFIFIGGLAVLLQVYILKLVRPDLSDEEDDSASILNLVRAVPQSANIDENKLSRATTIAASFSSLILFGLLACGVLIFRFLSNHVTGEQIGCVIVFLTGSQLVNLMLYNLGIEGKIFIRINTFLFGLAFAYTWFASDNWIVDDLCTVMVCLVGAANMIRPVPIKALVASSTAIVLYDFWGVWGSKSVGGGAIEGAVQNLVETHAPPILIISPAFPIDASSAASASLGLGDVVLPAFVICTAARYGLHRPVLVAYVIGLFVAGLISFQWHVSVPAMVPVLPIMLSTLFVAARFKEVSFHEQMTVIDEPESVPAP